MLVPTSQSTPQQWHYTFEEPADNWYRIGFDDSSWQQGPGGFGRQGTPGTVVKTPWHGDDIWLRRNFKLANLPSAGVISLTVHHDEDAEVYINGTLIRSFKGFTTGYATVPLSPQLNRVLKVGQNSLAVHCHQTSGGQYIDVGVALLTDRLP